MDSSVNTIAGNTVVPVGVVIYKFLQALPFRQTKQLINMTWKKNVTKLKTKKGSSSKGKKDEATPKKPSSGRLPPSLKKVRFMNRILRNVNRSRLL